MKKIQLFIILILTLTINSVFAQKCESLFYNENSLQIEPLISKKSQDPIPKIEHIKSGSSLIELYKFNVDSDSPNSTKLLLEAHNFATNSNEAVIDLMKLILQNSSYHLDEKNILTKNELVIGIPVINGFFFEITYKSVSNEKSQFIVDKISLKSQNGTSSKIADTFLKQNEISLKNIEHDLKSILGDGINAKLKIPLVIDGELLNKLDHLSKFFKFFKKEELRKLLETSSILKIKSVFELRRAKSIVTKLIVKEPAKAVIGFSFVVLATGSPLTQLNMLHLKPDEPIPMSTSAPITDKTSTVLGNLIDKIKSPNPLLQKELVALKNQIKAHHEKNISSTTNGLKYSELESTNKANSFSKLYSMWAFDKPDLYNNSIHTYIVFSYELNLPAGPALQYIVEEINPANYPELLKQLKSKD